MKKYTIEKLSKLQHEALYRHFKDVRAYVSSLYHFDEPRPHETLEEEQMEIYLQLVTQELQKRPYRKFNKETKGQQKKQNLAGLKGNRHRPRDKKRRKAP